MWLRVYKTNKGEIIFLVENSAVEMFIDVYNKCQWIEYLGCCSGLSVSYGFVGTLYTTNILILYIILSRNST